jgi:hypothetical protein
VTSLARWQRFWFSPVPVRRVAALRVLIAAVALAQVAGSTSVTGQARADGVFYEPTGLVRVLGFSRPAPELVAGLRIALIVCLACAVVGLLTRVALGISAPLFIWLGALANSYGKVDHGAIVLAFALVALAVAPAGRAYSVDALVRRGGAHGESRLAGWAMRVVMVAVAYAYLSAAFAKLRAAGLGWPGGGAFQAALLEHATPLGLRLAHHPRLVEGLAAAALLLEATAWLAFLRGRVRDAWCVAAASFHLGALALLGVNFLPQVIALAAFYDLEVGAERVRARLSDARARRTWPRSPRRTSRRSACA